MAKISSSIQQENYKIEIKSPSGNLLIADEPTSMGGRDLGFSPKELLASSLAACTSATVKIFADRKQWELEEVKIDVELEYSKEEKKTIIQRSIEFIGPLDEKQKKQLLAVANACPIHKILENPIEINTRIETKSQTL